MYKCIHMYFDIVCIDIFMHLLLYLHIYIYLHAYTTTETCVHIRIYIHTYMCMYTHIYIQKCSPNSAVYTLLDAGALPCHSIPGLFAPSQAQTSNPSPNKTKPATCRLSCINICGKPRRHGSYGVIMYALYRMPCPEV